MNYTEKAKQIVESRQKDYGDAVESWKDIAKTASILTGKKLTAIDCVQVLQAMKLRREHEKHKEDNLIDLFGYRLIEKMIRDVE